MLIDPSGKCVTGATVRALRPTGPRALRVGVDLKESEAGMYRLDFVRPGTPLLIQSPNFVPTCRIAPRNQMVPVFLETGRTIEVQFPLDITAAVLKELAVLSGVPGAECDIHLSSFLPEAIRQPTANEPALLRIDHFPSSYRLTLQRPGLVRQILVPDKGAVIVEQIIR